MMWWAIWCAAVVAGSAAHAQAAPAPDSLAQMPLDLVQIDSPTPDDESLGYAAPMGARYAAGAPWLYLLADMPRDSQVASSSSGAAMALRRRRRGFSVNPAVELLQRGAYNNYIGRIAHNNRDFLNCVGKRDPWSGADCQLKN